MIYHHAVDIPPKLKMHTTCIHMDVLDVLYERLLYLHLGRVAIG